MSYDDERKKRLEIGKDYYEKAIKDADDRLAKGKKEYPSGENVEHARGIFGWLLAKILEELEDRRKADE